MDTNLPVQSPNESIWEKFTGRHLALGEQLAKQSRERNDLGAMFANARAYGLSPTDQDRMEQEGRLKELTQQFVESTKDLDDTQYQQAANEFALANGAPHPQRETAQLESPNLAQSGFALLAAFLDPQHAAQNVTQPFIAQTQERDRKQGLNDQAYADQTRNRAADIDAAGTKYNIEERKLGKAQQSQDRQSNMIRQQMSDVENRLNKLDQKEQGAINQAYTQWNSANTPDEKELAGRRLQALLRKEPGLAPSEEEISGAVQQMAANGAVNASRMLDQAIKAKYMDGIVDEVDVASFEKQAQALAKQYGIPREMLPEVQTARSVQQKNFDLANQKFGFLKSKTKEDFKVKWANLKLAQQRADTYAQAVNNGYALGNVRNQIAYGHLQARTFGMAVKEMVSASQKEFRSLKGEIDVLSKLPVSKENTEKLQKKREELNQLALPIAEELGLDPAEMLKDPLNVTQTILDAIDEQEGVLKQKVEEIKINLPQAGRERPATKSERARANRAKPNKPMHQGGKLPPGWGKQGL